MGILQDLSAAAKGEEVNLFSFTGVRPLYVIGSGINSFFGGTEQQIAAPVEAISLYDSGNVLGDLYVPEQLPEGGLYGGGGWQVPVFNRHTPRAIGETFDKLLPDWLVPTIVIGGLAVATQILD